MSLVQKLRDELAYFAIIYLHLIPLMGILTFDG
jgi:hypothetical protein